MIVSSVSVCLSVIMIIDHDLHIIVVQLWHSLTPPLHVMHLLHGVIMSPPSLHDTSYGGHPR